MPELNDATPTGEPAPAAKRTTRARPAAPRKPRAPRKTAEQKRMEELQARKEELLAEVADAERRLTQLRREAAEAVNLTELRAVMTDARREIDAAREQAAEARRRAATALVTFREADALLDTARVSVEAVKDAVTGAEHAARSAEWVADRARGAAARARADVAAARKEFDTLAAESQEAVLRLRAVAVLAPAPQPAALPAPRPEPPRREPEPEPVPAADLLLDVEPLATDDAALGDARRRLVHYLNDAWATEKEQVDLLGMLAESADDPGLRGALDEHREASRRQQHAIEGRLRALGGEPAGGRGLLDQLVTRIWDALHKPRDPGEDAVEVLLKAVSAAEFEAGMYQAVHALARAAGDSETADLAAAHHREERAFADHLRRQITAAAVSPARVAVTA